MEFFLPNDVLHAERRCTHCHFFDVSESKIRNHLIFLKSIYINKNFSISPMCKVIRTTFDCYERNKW